MCYDNIICLYINDDCSMSWSRRRRRSLWWSWLTLRQKQQNGQETEQGKSSLNDITIHLSLSLTEPMMIEQGNLLFSERIRMIMVTHLITSHFFNKPNHLTSFKSTLFAATVKHIYILFSSAFMRVRLRVYIFVHMTYNYIYCCSPLLLFPTKIQLVWWWWEWRRRRWETITLKRP